MLKKNYFFVLLLVIWIVMLSLNNPSAKINIPTKKINKAISKIWKVEDFELIDHDLNIGKDCPGYGCWLKVKTDDKNLGKVYVGRVNSCRAGGCSIIDNDQSLGFEYFDYFFLIDHNAEVLWVKVYNYQATQGHEVMSRGWLNQFKGLSNNEYLVLGEDIEAISGATVSANAITENIQQVLRCIDED